MQQDKVLCNRRQSLYQYWGTKSMFLRFIAIGIFQKSTMYSKKKARHFSVSDFNFLNGDLYGIRTHECMRERHMS